MVIKAPNYTQIPNIYLEVIGMNLSLAEMRVMNFIFRKTLGWHKTKDVISIGQLEETTHLSRTNVMKAVKLLEKRGLIRKEVHGKNGSQRTEYHLIILEDKEILTSDEKSLVPVINNHCPPYPPLESKIILTSDEKSPTKERELKEKEKKESAGADRPPSANAEVPPLSPSSRKSKSEPYKQVDDEVWVTESQEANLLKRVKGDVAKLKQCYAKLSEWKLKKGVTGGKSDFTSLCNWVIDSVEKEPPKAATFTEVKENVNKKFAQENVKLWSHEVHKIGITPYGLEFYKASGTQHYTSIDFEDSAFKIKFNEEVKKRGFVFNG